MSKFQKLRTEENGWVTPEELKDVLANEGYAADERKQFLNALLTELAASPEDNTTGARRALRDEVETILNREQDKFGQEPISKDNT